MKNNYNLNVGALVFFFLLSIFSLNLSAQVGIGTTNPNAGSILDISSSDKGVLLPRVDISNLSNIAPLTSGAEGMLVYNTNTTTGPGFLFWNGSVWTPVSDGNGTDAWGRTGNANIDPTNNFVGTTDQQPLRLRTRNFPRFEITDGNAANGGRLRSFMDGSVNSPLFSWVSDDDTGIFRPADDYIGFTTGGNLRFAIANGNQVLAGGNGTNLLPFYSWGNDTDMGIYRIGNDRIGFATGASERVRIDNNGNVGINTGVNASEKLEVTGNFRLNGALMPGNQPGATDKILLSQGAGTAPVWGPGFLNTPAITNIGKYYTGTFTVPALTWYSVGIADPNMTTDTTIECNFVGALPSGPQYGNNVRLFAESRNGLVIFYITNATNFVLTNFEIVYTATYH